MSDISEKCRTNSSNYIFTFCVANASLGVHKFPLLHKSNLHVTDVGPNFSEIVLMKLFVRQFSEQYLKICP